MVQAEYEQWLYNENRKCEQVGRFVDGNKRSTQRNAKGGKTDTTSAEPEERNMGSKEKKVLGEWYDTYCSSCKSELRALDTGIERWSLAIT